MDDATLSEDIILLILCWLPLKCLIRFTCVSKRFHSIILSDPKYAQSQFQAARDGKSLTRRLLYSVAGPRLETLDLETPLFGDYSTVREIKFPFSPPSAYVLLLGSCNGIVFVAFHEKIFYAWNPSTGFFKRLPDPPISQLRNELILYGVGYLPATHDYRLIVLSIECDFENCFRKYVVATFSSRADAWKLLEVDTYSILPYRGILVKEALHWLRLGDRHGIVAFDLAQEEKHKFRELMLPQFDDDGGLQYENHLGVSAGGCLSVARYRNVSGDCVDVWVMGEYGVCDSWTKLFKLKFSDPFKEGWSYNHVLVLETSMVAQVFVHNEIGSEGGLVKILREKEDQCSVYRIKGFWFNMIHYQESLLRIGD